MIIEKNVQVYLWLFAKLWIDNSFKNEGIYCILIIRQQNV